MVHWKKPVWWEFPSESGDEYDLYTATPHPTAEKKNTALWLKFGTPVVRPVFYISRVKKNEHFCKIGLL